MGLSLPRLAILRPAPLRKRLWQGGIALVAVIGTFVIGNFFVAGDKAVTSRTVGHDFLAFYTAGTLARTGDSEKLYDLPAARQFQQELATRNGLEIGESFAPYWNPPFYAWLPAIFSNLPYTRALASWTVMNVICLAVAMGLLVQMLPRDVREDWRIWGLIPLLILTSMPFIQAIGHGQNTFLSLMLLSLVVTVWRKQMPVTAGLLCGLMFYKPQLAAVVAGMLVLTLGARVCLGLGFVAGMLLLITGVSMPYALGNFLTQLPGNLHEMQILNTYVWDRHVTLRGFWRLLIQGMGPGEISIWVNMLTLLCMGAIGSGLLICWRRYRRRPIDDCWTGETRGGALDRVIVATIISMPLLMPFYFDYDLLLLAVPAVLTAGEVLAISPGGRMDRVLRWLVGTWIGLYAFLLINPPLAKAAGVNVAVIWLGVLCGLSIARAAGNEARTLRLRLPNQQEPATARMAA